MSEGTPHAADQVMPFEKNQTTAFPCDQAAAAGAQVSDADREGFRTSS